MRGFSFHILLSLANALASGAGNAAAHAPFRSTGGELEPGFHAVGAISLDGSIRCSGAVVGRRTVLTAAHCIRGESNWRGHMSTFTLGQTVTAAAPQDIYRVTTWRVPNFELPAIAYDELTNTDDIALVYVDRDFHEIGPGNASLPLTPLAIADSESYLTQAGNDKVRLIGYGISAPGSPDEGIGDRRRIDLPLGRLAAKTFELANVARRACKGDSGGPVVYPASEKNSHIVGVVSAGIVNGDNRALCFDQSVITRVDRYSDWLLKFIDHPPP